MKTEKIAEAVTDTATVTYMKRPPLVVNVCEGCGRRFRPRSSNMEKIAVVRGIFDRCAPNVGGNGFEATACSYACAGELVAGGWRQLERYKGFARSKSTRLLWTEYRLDDLATEEELRAEWEKTMADPPADGSVVRRFETWRP